MSIAIERRITKLEDELLPKPETKWTVLMEPRRDSKPEDVADYLKKLAQARRNDDNIMVVRLHGMGCPEREKLTDVRYVETEWQAQAAILASQPSEHGNKNALEDMVRSLSGNVLGVVANPPPDVYEIQAMRNQ